MRGVVTTPTICCGVQKLDDTTPQVREAAFEAMGTLLKVMGERAMTSYVESIDKAKMTKVSIASHHTVHIITQYTSSHSAPRHTVHLITQYTSSHSTPHDTMHLITQYTSSHSTHHTVHLITQYTSSHSTPHHTVHRYDHQVAMAMYLYSLHLVHPFVVHTPWEKKAVLCL